ncbi:hypothetical protein [Streptomyces xinghaiensis]|uniref:hypothetical protein n=1 Tax=Streptomyces xinghaiensis TaxID=1038928 RepID=UPI003428A145
MWLVSPARRARPPSAHALAAGRLQTQRCFAILDGLSRGSPASPVLTGPGTAPVRAAVRAAAVRGSVIAVYREKLQRVSAWLALPLCGAAVLWLAGRLLGPGGAPQPPTAGAAVLAAGGLLLNAVLLVCAVVAGRPALHAAGAVAGALFGMAVLLFPTGPPPFALRVLLLFVLTPAAMYAAFAPLLVMAYLTAVRLARIVDPRARIILGLLQCLHRVSAGTGWLHQRVPRRQVLGSLERIARIAQYDLLRLLPSTVSDPETRLRHADHAYAIATRLRECKRRAVLPSAGAREDLPVELAQLLLHICREEWEDLRAADPPSRLPGRMARLAKRLAATLLLMVAAFALPALFHASLPEPAGRNVRDLLLVSAVLCLVPLRNDVVNRIPDTFASALK